MAAIFFVFLRLGLLSFGGPVAHLGYFRTEFVERRKWFDDKAYSDLVAMGQFLPGPASSQVGFAIGLLRGGLPGGLAAWIGFTLPSAVIMIAAAMGLALVGDGGGWIAGLKIVAVAVIAHALLGMARQLCTTPTRMTIAAAGAAVALLVPGSPGQLLAIVIGLAAGLATERPEGVAERSLPPVPYARWLAVPALALFFVLLALSLVPQGFGAAGDFLAPFYAAGALVFGGGHVVLPLLQGSMVPSLVDQETFLAGYGVAQALPGPLFTIASFLGTAADTPIHPIIGGLLATVAIFLPGMLLVIGVLPLWQRLSANHRAAGALAGVNAAVVGILGAAFWMPVVDTTITTPLAAVLALAGFVALVAWKAPPWGVAAGGAVLGWILL